jgi:biopolymer transport protein ExbD
MTAMVDVAFLLLTFFVLTATMTNSAMMELTLPPKEAEEDPDGKVKVDEKKIMTLILTSGDTVIYFVGITEPEIKYATFGEDGVRKILLEHLNRERPLCKQVDNAKGCWDPIFLVKPKKDCRYKNVVDLLDELAITEAPKFAMVKYADSDSLFLEDAILKMEEKAKAEN